jgi:hypothetical protein
MMALYNTISTSGNGGGNPGFGDGQYPPASYQADGTPLWVAFGIFYQSNSDQNSFQVGKFTPSFGEALFPFGGQELGTGAGEFSVLVSSGIWVPNDPLVVIPVGAIVLGYDVDGEPLFAALADLSQLPIGVGGTHPGKTKASFNGQASIGYGGQEYFVNTYSILVGGV